MGKHMNLDDRMSIQTGLKDNLSFTEIAKNSGKDKSTIRREILNHRIFIPYYADAQCLCTPFILQNTREM